MSATVGMGAERSSVPGQTEGQYRGERVVSMPDPRSLLQDAAEEMTFQHGEKAEKSLARRRIRDGDQRTRKTGLSQVQQVSAKLGDLKKSVLERTLQILLRMQHARSFDLRQQVREQLPEPSHQTVPRWSSAIVHRSRRSSRPNQTASAV
jgi:type III secretion protein W